MSTQPELTGGARAAPSRPVLRRTVSATPGQPTALRHALTHWARACGLTVDQIGELILASYEALTNVVKHAYPADAAGKITLLATCTDNVALVVISDRGCWRAPPTPRHGRGHGLTMMRTLSDDIQIDHAETGTTVHLRWNLVSNPDSGSDPKPLQPAHRP